VFFIGQREDGDRTVMMEPAAFGKKVTVDEVRAILIERTGVPRDAIGADDDAALTDLGVDSLAVMELAAVLRDEYGLTVPEDAITMSPKEIVRMVNGESLDVS
jgi:acyl carrier protein